MEKRGVRLLAMAVVFVLLSIAAVFLAHRRWREWFPYHDGIVEQLPEATVAYAHVNLTGSVRRALRRELPRVAEAIPGQSREVITSLLPALGTRQITELAFVWVAPEAAPPYVAVLLGQPASRHSDVSIPQNIQENELFRVRVIRTTDIREQSNPLNGFDRTTSPLRNRPIQIAFLPKAIPIDSIEPIRNIFPEIVTLAGTLDHRGIIVRTPGAVASHRAIQMPMIDGDSKEAIVIRIPAQVAANTIVAVDRELAKALQRMIPEELFVFLDRFGIRGIQFMPTNAPVSTDALRKAVALMFPTVKDRTIAGFLTSVATADPSSVRILKENSSAQWMVTANPESHPVLFAAQVFEFIMIAKSSEDRSLIGESKKTASISSRCAVSSNNSIRVAMHVSIFPHAQTSFSLDLFDGSLIACVQP